MYFRVQLVKKQKKTMEPKENWKKNRILQNHHVMKQTQKMKIMKVTVILKIDMVVILKTIGPEKVIHSLTGVTIKKDERGTEKRIGVIEGMTLIDVEGTAEEGFGKTETETQDDTTIGM